MVNTHILALGFDYFEPASIGEALRLMAEYDGRVKVLAGGTDLLVQMKKGSLPAVGLVSLAKIPGLRKIAGGGGLTLGPMTPFRDLERSPLIRETCAALWEAAQSVSSTAIKNMATLGGNLCHASPAADSAPPLIAFDARAKIVSKAGERISPLEVFFIGPGETVLSPGELLVDIQVPEITGYTGSAFFKIARVAADLAKVNGAVRVTREQEVCLDCRIVLGAVGRTPLRAQRAEAVLRGEKMKKELLEEAGRQAAEEIRPIDDVRSTAWYRKEVSRVLVRNALGVAWRRAGGAEIS